MARGYDSVVFKVFSIEYKRVKKAKQKIRMVYRKDSSYSYYQLNHKTKYKAGRKLERMIIFSINEYGNKTRVCKIFKINDRYVYVQVHNNKLVVDRYLSIYRKNQNGSWQERHYYNTLNDR